MVVADRHYTIIAESCFTHLMLTAGMTEKLSEQFAIVLRSLVLTVYFGREAEVRMESSLKRT
jgi:hypothetical protein